jgi:DNA-binding MarR family transcriptional regulator
VLEKDVAAVLENYPRIYFACHTRHVREPLSGDVLSSHQVSILDHLSSSEATSLAELAAHMGVTPSTMSLATERLVGGGYVRRTRDRVDKRRLRLLLTAKGQRVREAHSVLDPVRVSAVLRRLSEPDRARALRGLELLARAAAAENEHRTRAAEGDAS